MSATCCRELDKLVMNFLVIEGYQEAANHFSLESGLPLAATDHSAIALRTDLRRLFLAGAITDAIALLNDHDPDLLDSRDDVVFAIRLLQLLEAIKGNALAAVQLAREQVAPLVKGDSERMRSLQKVLSLVLIPPSNLQKGRVPKAIESLIDIGGQRGAVAGLVNAALLEAGGHEAESLLPKIIRLRSCKLD